ncbi:MAG: hypothetical protein ACE5JX_03680 [Acidobacteriota bacterium]
MLAYLSGSIEFAPAEGRGWRRALKPFLEERLGHRVYDPAADEKKNLTHEEMAHFRSWKTTDLDRFRQTVRKIIDFDLDLIESDVDYIVCSWDRDSGRGGGTQAELTAAYRKGIPVFLVTELPLGEISGWVLACARRIFSDVDELKSHLLATYGKRPGRAGA